jgi:hypothetical protein
LQTDGDYLAVSGSNALDQSLIDRWLEAYEGSDTAMAQTPEAAETSVGSAAEYPVGGSESSNIGGDPGHRYGTVIGSAAGAASAGGAVAGMSGFFPTATPEMPGTVSLDEAARRSLGLEVRLGALGVDVPPLRQGHREIVKVAISRDEQAQTLIATYVADSQVPDVDVIKTSAVMVVDLTGSTFDIRRLNPADGEQLVSETAVWEFYVLPKAAGVQVLTVSASMRIPVPEHGERTVSVPSLVKECTVKVDRLYVGRSFVGRNWQWILTTVIAAAAAAAAIAAVIWRS